MVIPVHNYKKLLAVSRLRITMVRHSVSMLAATFETLSAINSKF